MKIGVAFYLKNIDRYPVDWVNQCFESIENQTYQDFNVYILNYGEESDFGFKYKVPVSFVTDHNCDYFQKPLNNYADAMNHIYERIFETCDVAVNTNIDDYYSPNRIELLLQDLHNGADIASSNYYFLSQSGQITHSPRFDQKNVYEQLKRGLNPVSNPCHIMRKRVFEQLKFDSNLVPIEDMDYWKKAIEAGFKIHINPEYLHYYRWHPGQVTRSMHPKK